IGLGTPEIACIEPHGVEPLWVLALPERVCVWENVGATQLLHGPDSASDVPRQAGVRRRIDVLCSHPVADAKARGSVRWTLGRPSRTKNRFHPSVSQDVVDFLWLSQRPPCLQFVRRYQTARGQQFLQPGKPDLIVTL